MGSIYFSAELINGIEKSFNGIGELDFDNNHIFIE